MTTVIRHYGLVDYLPTYAAMQAFTAERTADTPDELWLCEHRPVYTQGLAGQAQHVLQAGAIPVVATNRGGQVTYHGPGQVVAYPLIDLKRAGYFVKEFVYRIEESVIRTLAHFGVTGHRVRGAPGIYVRLDAPGSHARLPAGMNAQQLGSDPNLAKVAALGIKVSRHCTLHGVALNVAMDLEPYQRINACGYADLVTTDLAHLGVQADGQAVQTVLSHKLCAYLVS